MSISIAPLSRTLLLLSLGISALTLPAVAQQTAPAARQPILLDVMVTKSNKPVPNLKQQDFTVLDDGHHASITVFHQHNLADVPANEVDASTTVIIVLDEVNTPFERVIFARQGIQAFLREHDGKLEHPTTVAILTDSGLQMQTQPSVDGNALAAALGKQEQRFRAIEEGAQFGSSQRVALSLDALDKLIAVETTRPGRKVVFWVGHGWPYLTGQVKFLTAGQEKQTLATAIKLSTNLRQARMTLYSLDPFGVGGVGTHYPTYYKTFLQPLTDSNQANLADLSLQVLSIQSGGRVLFGNGLTQNYLDQAMNDLKAFYTLLISPSPSTPAAGFHAFDVKLSSPDLQATTRNGYYGN